MALKSGRVGIHPSQVDPITGMLLSSPGGASDLADLDDVTISNPEAGQLLLYDGDKWENQFASISPIALASLQDVSIDNPEEGQQLVYNGSTWENQFASISPMTLSQLRDVVITDPQDDDYLMYDSTAGKWINSGSAPTPIYTDVTFTIYSAVEDLISFTDASGVSKTEQLAENQSSKEITIKINSTGSTDITFTSSVAKDPDNLSNPYSKTVSISSGTTSVYFMPNDNTIYWYGYTTVAFTGDTSYYYAAQGYTNVNNQINKNNMIIGNNSTSDSSYLGSTSTVSLTGKTKLCLLYTITAQVGNWTGYQIQPNKGQIAGVATDTANGLDYTKHKHELALTDIGNRYITFFSNNNVVTTFYIYGLWLE